MIIDDKTFLIDTNVILRYLLDDHPQFSPKATKFMTEVSQSKRKAEIPEVVLLESIYVMEKFYKIPRKTIVDRLSRIITFNGIINSNKSILISALLTYQQHTIDFVDCLLYACSSPTRPVASFDRDFDRLNAHVVNL